MWDREESLQALEVGDKITVNDHYHGPVRLTKVARVTKAMIVTVRNDREEKWSRRTGKQYGQDTNSWYIGQTITATVDEDYWAIIRRILKTHCPLIKWEEVTEATLREFWGFYKLLPKKE